MSTTLSRLLCPLVVGFALAACASGPPPGPTPAQIAGMQAETIAISPMNIVSSLPTELEGSTQIVVNALVEVLEAHGKKAVLIGYRAGRDLWRDSKKEVRESGLPPNFDNAARIYARKIGEQFEFDALIVPSIFIQNARKRRSSIVRWDDAEQSLEIRGDSRGVTLADVTVKAASLFVQILDREGNSIHTKRVGLELIQHLTYGAERGSGYSDREDRASKFINSWEMTNDVPPIQDEERVRAGVAATLSPFLQDDLPLPDRPISEIDPVS